MAGTYITPTSPSATAGMLTQAETAVLLGSQRLYDSLEHTSWTYITYEISIGLKAGQSTQLGLITDLTFSHKPSFEPLEAFNMSDDPLYQVTGEETMASITVAEFKPDAIEVAIGTGARYDLGNEVVFSIGSGCNMLRRPYSFEFVNAGCYAPASEDINVGISGGAITLYDAFVQSGVEWAMNAKEGNTIPLEIQALPVADRARGNRLGSIYLY